MKVSLNWIRFINEKYGCSADPLPEGGMNELVEKIGAQLGAVEEVIDLGKKYVGIVVVKVVSCQKHPNADKLSVCLIDDGGVARNIKRNKDGFVEIVCGAPNVKAGMLAAWIPPGNTVPNTYDKEPFVIEAREIREVISNGMLASPKELALSDDHEGILVVDEDVKPGTKLIEAYKGLDEYVIDIENKMFTHRPDCFGILGIARELAGIQNHTFKSPSWYRSEAKVPKGNARETHKLVIKNEISNLVPRFCAVVIKDVDVRSSPIWLQVRLNSVGIRPINNVVDMTNFYMIETAQPLHAYDYDKFLTLQKSKTDGVKMGVRLSRKDEELKLLGGKRLNLDKGSILITADDTPVGLGGVMGGAETEVDENTRCIILESANFDMRATRTSAMKYGLFTDAATRFTKNQSPLQNTAVLAYATEDILRVASGRMCGEMHDDNHIESAILKRNTIHEPIKLSTDFINSRVGLNLSSQKIAKLLTNVEFKVSQSGNSLTITAPFWRTDIEIREDIVEEVGRLYGYEHLPLELPTRDLTPAKVNSMVAFKTRLRNILSTAGVNEALTYTFVNESLLKKAGQDPKDGYHIRNALSPDLQYYRLSLTPSLLEKIHPNIKGGFDEFGLFEIGKGHNKKMKDEKEKNLPKEFEMLSVVVASKLKSPKNNGASYYQARVILDYLAHELNIDLDYRPIPSKEDYQVAQPFDHERSASVWDKQTKIPLGMIGEYELSIASDLKLPKYCAGLELGIDELIKAANLKGKYQSLNRFPSLDQDICLRSSTDLIYDELTDFIKENLAQESKERGYNFELQPLDIFQYANDKTHKQTTWRVKLWHPEKTLTTQEANKILDKIAACAAKELKAERV